MRFGWRRAQISDRVGGVSPTINTAHFVLHAAALALAPGRLGGVGCECCAPRRPEVGQKCGMSVR